MQLPISLFIGLRYSQSRKGNAFISFITFFSVAGIFLGVAALTIVSSVMNGFEAQLKQRILGVIPHMLVQVKPEVAAEKVAAQLPSAVPSLVQSVPFLQAEALVQSSKDLTGALVQGVDTTALPAFLQQSLLVGSWESFAAEKYPLIVGAGLADKLRIQVGQKVRLLLPSNGTYTPLGWMPRQRLFVVTGIFETGSEVDQLVAVTKLADLQRLTADKTATFRLSLTDPFAAPELSDTVAKLDGVQQVTDWRQTHGKLFAAVAMEKSMMWLMLLLIVAVAAFNIVSALVMMVTEKQREVAILKTQGMTNGQLFQVFAIQGMSHGVSGAVLGAIAGLLLCGQLNNLMNLIGLQLVPGMELPVLVKPSQVIWIMVSALGLTALAVVYPAWRAVQVDPAQVLRDE
ncbi:MAG TPA: lipoprotein-releasing ABC transporter permease subunit [Rheinheimera sp.]|nr:lipoprotein-releasing ABC transporter permease subunit [Rheinheimera sp.]